jgi:hypothetical protein
MKIYFLKKYDIKPSFIISATLLIIVISSIIYGSFVIYNQKKTYIIFAYTKNLTQFLIFSVQLIKIFINQIINLNGQF